MTIIASGPAYLDLLPQLRLSSSMPAGQRASRPAVWPEEWKNNRGRIWIAKQALQLDFVWFISRFVCFLANTGSVVRVLLRIVCVHTPIPYIYIYIYIFRARVAMVSMMFACQARTWAEKAREEGNPLTPEDLQSLINKAGRRIGLSALENEMVPLVLIGFSPSTRARFLFFSKGTPMFVWF